MCKFHIIPSRIEIWHWGFIEQFKRTNYMLCWKFSFKNLLNSILCDQSMTCTFLHLNVYNMQVCVRFYLLHQISIFPNINLFVWLNSRQEKCTLSNAELCGWKLSETSQEDKPDVLTQSPAKSCWSYSIHPLIHYLHVVATERLPACLLVSSQSQLSCT